MALIDRAIEKIEELKKENRELKKENKALKDALEMIKILNK